MTVLVKLHRFQVYNSIYIIYILHCGKHMEAPPKTKNRVTMWPSNPSSGSLLEKSKTFIYRDTCTLVFTAALFAVAKTWKLPECPLVDDWDKKMGYIYTMELYSAIRKDEVQPFMTTWMNLENIVLSKIGQKKLRVIWFHSYVRYKTERNKWTNKKNKWTETHRHRQQYGGF